MNAHGNTAPRMKRTIAALILSAFIFVPVGLTPVLAYDVASTAAVNVDAKGLAIRGYDPVAYFTVGKPTPGNGALTASYDGATYRFANAGNRDAFVADPARYAPAFGGFCAMGAVMAKKFDGDPQVWKVVEGKLYLNVSQLAQTRWLEDVPGNIAKASANWPKIKDKAPKDL